MGLGIGKAEGRAPAAAEHHPFFDAAHIAQPLDILDQMPGRVRLEVGVRGRFARAALVEQQDVIFRRIELAAMVGADPRAGAAVEEDDRLGARRPAPLPIKRMAVADVEHAALVGLNLRIERSKVASSHQRILVWSCLYSVIEIGPRINAIGEQQRAPHRARAVWPAAVRRERVEQDEVARPCFDCRERAERSLRPDRRSCRGRSAIAGGSPTRIRSCPFRRGSHRERSWR